MTDHSSPYRVEDAPILGAAFYTLAKMGSIPTGRAPRSSKGHQAK